MMLVRTKPHPLILNIIAFQPALRPALPCVYGPIEFHRQRAFFQRMDEIINEAKLEEEFITLAVKEHGVDLAKVSGKKVERFARYSGLAFRCNMAGMILGLDARGLSMRAADSPLLQWFLRISAIDKIKAPSKSAVDRFSRWISEAGLRRLNDKLMGLLALSPDAGRSAPFKLKEAIGFDEMFFDATCLKANIHFPVDWVLLRDIARTLMKATVLIR